MPALLDHIFWHALNGPQAAQAAGSGAARRYAAGFSPLAAFADAAAPDFAAFTPWCEPGEALYCGGWSGPVPAGWRLEAQATMVRMVWDGAMAAGEAPRSAGRQAPAMVALGQTHVPQMLALTALTQPGPFGPRTWELGDYIGCFGGDRLVAMAGERAHAGRWREVSGVCTHPDFQGRGLARHLMLALVKRQLARGETPFVHVMSHNTGAHALYARMGFRDQAERVVRVVSRRCALERRPGAPASSCTARRRHRATCGQPSRQALQALQRRARDSRHPRQHLAAGQVVFGHRGNRLAVPVESAGADPVAQGRHSIPSGLRGVCVSQDDAGRPET